MVLYSEPVADIKIQNKKLLQKKILYSYHSWLPLEKSSICCWTKLPIEFLHPTYLSLQVTDSSGWGKHFWLLWMWRFFEPMAIWIIVLCMTAAIQFVIHSTNIKNKNFTYIIFEAISLYRKCCLHPGTRFSYWTAADYYI